MSASNLTSIVLFLGVCILISLGVGYLLVEHMRLLEKFSLYEGMVVGAPEEGLIYFFYSPQCPLTPEARKVWDQIRENPRIRKVEVDCTDPSNQALCAREGIDSVPTFKVSTKRMTKRIHAWNNLEKVLDAINEAIEPITLRVVMQS